MDIHKCHQIIEGLRLLILQKDEDLKQLEMKNGLGFSNVGSQLVPVQAQQEIDLLKGENAHLQTKISDLKDEIRYMKKVQITQSKALDNSTSVNQDQLLKGQADEIRHMKRKKYEIAAELDKVKQ